MVRDPWDITADMFLSTVEMNALLEHVRHRTAEAEERNAVMAAIDRLIVEVMLFSGLRNSEFCRLALGDVPLGEGAGVILVRGTRGPDRRVHVPGEIVRLVAGYVEVIRPRCLPEEVSREDASLPLVYHERRGPYERTGLYRRVVRILGEAGLGARASVQLLRHTYGYHAYLRTGGNLLFVQRQLGHANPMITSIYAKLVEESYEAMAEQVWMGSEVQSAKMRSEK